MDGVESKSPQKSWLRTSHSVYAAPACPGFLTTYLGRCHPIRGRILTAPAGGPLPDDARLPGEAARADLAPQAGAVAIARRPARLEILAEGIENAAATVGMPPGRRMAGTQPAAHRLAADAQCPGNA